MSTPFFRSDDIFLLGNIGLLALSKGLAGQALEAIRLVQVLRPDNGASFIIEAMHLYSKGETLDALRVIESCTFDELTRSKDETLAFHLYLLAELDQFDQVFELGQSYLTGNRITSEAARHTIETVLEETRAKAPEPRPCVCL